MYSIPSQEDTVMVVKAFSHSLSNLQQVSIYFAEVPAFLPQTYLIASPPVTIFVRKLIRVDDLLSCFQDTCGRDL